MPTWEQEKRKRGWPSGEEGGNGSGPFNVFKTAYSRAKLTRFVVDKKPRWALAPQRDWPVDTAAVDAERCGAAKVVVHAHRGREEDF